MIHGILGIMTIGIGAVVGDSIVLAADSRVLGDTIIYPPSHKIGRLGPVSLIWAGDLAQAQSVLRKGGDVQSIDGLVDHLEAEEAGHTEWLAACDGQLAALTPGEGSAICIQDIPPGSWAVIGSGGYFVRGFLAAYPAPRDPDRALDLCYAAMAACSKHMICVGPPYAGRILAHPGRRGGN